MIGNPRNQPLSMGTTASCVMRKCCSRLSATQCKHLAKMSNKNMRNVSTSSSDRNIVSARHVSVTFHAVTKDVMIYWKGRDGDQDRYIAHVRKGEVFNEMTYPNHIFRTYDATNKDNFIDHQIQANFGDHKSIQVEL